MSNLGILIVRCPFCESSIFDIYVFGCLPLYSQFSSYEAALLMMHGNLTPGRNYCILKLLITMYFVEFCLAPAAFVLNVIPNLTYLLTLSIEKFILCRQLISVDIPSFWSFFLKTNIR